MCCSSIPVDHAKTDKLSEASTEEKKFVRSKLLHLNHRKWNSTSTVQSTAVNHQHAVKASGVADKAMIIITAKKTKVKQK